MSEVQNVIPIPDGTAPLPGEIGSMREESLEGPGSQPGEPRLDDGIPDFPIEEPPAETPVTPEPEPANQAVTPPAQQPTVAVTEDDLRKVLERFGGDVNKLAQAYAHAERMIGRQGQQLGELRKQTQPPAQNEQPIGDQQAQPGQPAQPAAQPQSQQQNLPQLSFHVRPAEQLTWERDAKDPESGFPLDAQGNPYDPHDELDVPVRNPEVWMARARQLAEQYPDAAPTDIMFTVQQERDNFEKWRHDVRSQREQELFNYQQHVAVQYVPQIEQQLGTWYPEPVVREIVRDAFGKASQGVINMRASGQNNQLASEPGIIARAMGEYITYLFTSGQLRGMAEGIAARLGTNGQPNGGTNGQQAQREVLPPPTPGAVGGTKASAVPGAKQLVDSGFIKPEDADRFMSKDFEFDGF